MDIVIKEIGKVTFEKKKSQQYKIYASLKNNLCVVHLRRILDQNICKTWFNTLEKIAFPKETYIKLHGKNVKIPRQQIAYGNVDFKYNGITVKPEPWISLPELIKLRVIVNNITGYKYNFVLLNKYRNGNDYISYHKDNDADLEDGAPIVSVTFGAARVFSFKHDDEKIDEISMMLTDGDILLIMSPTNKYWKHSILKNKKCTGVRYNFTFRKIKN